MRLSYYSRSGLKENVSACGALNLYEPTITQTVITSAEVIFKYPIVGRILFRQPQDQFWEDTTILIEYLIHADGASVNDTTDHKFALHEKPPNKDFYDWQNRCTSVGKIFDTLMTKDELKDDTTEFQLIGHLSSRHGQINVAGSRDNRKISRVLFTDSRISLTGANQIIGKSIVIYDENGPKARGNRMACST